VQQRCCTRVGDQYSGDREGHPEGGWEIVVADQTGRDHGGKEDAEDDRLCHPVGCHHPDPRIRTKAEEAGGVGPVGDSDQEHCVEEESDREDQACATPAASFAEHAPKAERVAESERLQRVAMPEGTDEEDPEKSKHEREARKVSDGRRITEHTPTKAKRPEHEKRDRSQAERFQDVATARTRLPLHFSSSVRQGGSNKLGEFGHDFLIHVRRCAHRSGFEIARPPLHDLVRHLADHLLEQAPEMRAGAIIGRRDVPHSVGVGAELVAFFE